MFQGMIGMLIGDPVGRIVDVGYLVVMCVQFCKPALVAAAVSKELGEPP